MKSKSLETLIARESGLYSDMVTRFQVMRKYGRLSRSRGKNAELLSTEEVVYGILSVVADRPNSAGITAIGLFGMYPAGLKEDAFAQEQTLGKALAALLESDELLDSLIEVRLGDSDPRAQNSTTAEIVYMRDGQRAVSQYICKTAVSLFHKGKELEFDRRDMGEFSVVRETVLAPRFFKRVANSMAEEKQHFEMMRSFEEEHAKLQKS